MTKVKRCCFCKTPLTQYDTNNAEPIRTGGICCNKCNENIVVPYRILMANASTVHIIREEDEV